MSIDEKALATVILDDPNRWIANVLKDRIAQDSYANYAERDGHLIILMTMDTHFGSNHIGELKASATNAVQASTAGQRNLTLALQQAQSSQDSRRIASQNRRSEIGRRSR